MPSKKILLTLFVSSGIFLASCSQHTTQSTPVATSYTALNGNWHIAGEPGSGLLPLAQSPLLTLAIGVSGSTVYASATVGVTCSSGAEIGGPVGGGMSLTGPIASDGTFTLSNSGEPADTIQITIQGQAPVEGATTWSGNYTVVNANPPTGCIFNDANSFVATLYPPLDGTYTGTVTGAGLDSGWTVSVQMTQGAFTSATLSPNSSTLVYFTPLNSTIQITGSSTLTTGTSAANPIQGTSSISGDAFIVNYIMNDGSTLSLSGWFMDSSESTLQVGIMSFGGSVGASGTLTKQ